MTENRWSHGDPNDPLSWHLDELRYEAECKDPLAPSWFDSLVLVSRKYTKGLVGRAITANNRSVWESINNLEEQMSAVDDALAEADAVTNEIAADLDALAAELADSKSKSDQATAEKIRVHTDKLRGVASKYPPVVSEEPVADGEPLPDSSPQTVPVEGQSDIPVSHFPAEEPVPDGSVADGEPVPDGGVDTSGE